MKLKGANTRVSQLAVVAAHRCQGLGHQLRRLEWAWPGWASTSSALILKMDTLVPREADDFLGFQGWS